MGEVESVTIVSKRSPGRHAVRSRLLTLLDLAVSIGQREGLFRGGTATKHTGSQQSLKALRADPRSSKTLD